MKKRILSIILSIVMLVSLLPATAFAIPATHSHAICGAEHTDIGDHTGSCEDIPWTAWDGGSISTSGNYYLSSSPASAASIKIGTEGGEAIAVKLCLNGQTLSVTLFEIINATVDLCDCSNKGSGKIIGTETDYTVYQYGTSQTEFNMYGGTISGISKNGAVNVYGYEADHTFNMYGGTVTNAYSNTQTGAVNVYGAGGKFNMYGGTIKDCTGKCSGVYAAGGATVTMAGGTIENNNAGTYGGGVYLSGWSGAVPTFTMTGGRITNNQSANGGGVYIIYGTFNMSGTAAISNNQSTNGGGGVHMYHSAYTSVVNTFNMTGGSITNNTGRTGGGVDMGGGSASTFTMTGGTITGNTATGSGGGGVFLRNGTLSVSGTAAISDNTAKNGGGVYLNGGTLTMTGGTVTGNTATGDGGGGVYLSSGTFTVSGSPVITGNTKSGNANNVYLTSDNTITVNGKLTGGNNSIGVKMEAPGVFAEPDGTNVKSLAGYVNFFTSDNANYKPAVDGNNLSLVSAVVPVTGVTLDKNSITLGVGSTETLTATVEPDDATNKAVTWSSDAESVATVDQTGKVTAVSEGTATITATTADGGYTATCNVTVNKIAITGTIAITTTQEPTVGQTFDLNCIVIPTGNYSYTTKAIAPNASIEAGKNYILSIGLKPNDGYYFADNVTATISGKAATVVHTTENNISIQYTYSFASPAANSVDIYLNDDPVTSEQSLTLPGKGQANNQRQYTVKVLDQYGHEITSPTVEWSITQATGVSVDTTGLVAVTEYAAEGNYTLTATCDGKSDSITIQVKKAESVVTAIKIFKDGTEISEDTIYIPENGRNSAIYTAEVYDQYGDTMTAEEAGAEWSHENKDPATGMSFGSAEVDDNDLIRKVYIDASTGKAGVFDLVITSDGKRASVHITFAYLETQTITCANVTGTYGQTEELKLNPSGKQTAGAYRFAIKSGASTDVVEVAADGKLTIKNAGETTIVVTAPGDATHASASVEVKVTVDKADITEYTDPTANDLTYNGSAQALITEGSATGGSMMYAIGTAEQATDEWSTDVPTGTDIGTYYVWYKVVGDRNHNNKTFETPITVTIAPNTYIVTYLPGINGTGTQTTDTKTQGVVLTLRGAIFTRTGYTQTGWATTDGSNQAYALGASYTDDAPITLYPVWTANTNTAYTVEHWQQNVERTGYVKVDTDEEVGTTGAETEAAAKTYTGFTAQSFNQVAIAADGGTVVKIYYNRNTYTVTYTDNDAFLSNVAFEDVVYGAKAPAYPGTPTRPSYTFGGWYKDSGLTTAWDFENDTITGPTTIYAKWTEKANVSIDEDAQTYTWDGNPKSFAITGTPNNEFTVQYKINDNWTTAASSAVGTYDVKITRAEDDTYKAYEKIITGGLVINAATPTATAPTAKTGLVYDGNAQALINAGTSEHGHWEYSLGGTSYYSDIPTGTDAKTYTVYCRFVPNTGYANIDPVELSVTIDPMAVDEPTVVGSYTYTGSEQTVTLDGVLGCMTVSGNKATHAGDYEVSIALDGNHKWNAESDGKIAWSIVAKTVTPTAALEYASIIYSGSERKPTVTLKDGDTEIPSGEYTVSYSNNVNVGTATVTITDKENGNYTFAEITKTFEIMKDGVSPVLSMDDYVYGGTPAVPNVSGNAGSGTVTVYYSTDSSRVDKLWEDISGTTLNVGTYYMKAHVAATDNYAEGISPVITFKVTPGKYTTPSAPTASEFTVTINEADRGKILEYSLDGTNWINVPVLTNGAFELKGLSESTQYTVYLRAKASADGNYQASDAVSTVWTTPARYSVAYHANLGTGNVPISVTQNSGRSVTVARGSGLKRTGYTFAGWNTAADGTGTDYAPGSTISTGATLYAKWTANSYTVKFKANGGSGTMDDQNFTYDVTQALTGNAFTRDGYHFAGWALSSGNTAIYMDGQTIKNLSDKGTVTLHAVWAEDVYKIGADFSSESDHQIIAKLMRGDAQIGSEQSVTMSGTDAPYTGHFDFTGVPMGIYNIVAEQDGKVITKLIIITDHDDTVEITMPASEVNSVLEVSEDALPVVVGGLEDEAVTKAEESKTVTITMTVEKQEEQQLPDNASESEKATQEAIAEIKEEASSKTFEFMDIEVEKTVEEGQANVSEKLTETNKVMEIVIPFDLTGKRDITVYRHHNGQAEQFTENTTKADGTFYIDEVNHLIHVFSRKFSTYAIGYTEPAPYYPPVISAHSCTSKCKVCGGCEDANCNENACKDKCRLLGMNFSDVADGKWYTEPVAYVYHHKMMEGVDNNLFDINGTTTRAMIVTILWRLEGEPVVNYLMQFEDVPADTWYTEAVRWAASEKIVKGYSDTAFGPADAITREQFATILWRYAKYKGYDVSAGEDTNILSYEDAFSISEYAIPAMQWACGAGLMQGDGVNLTPKADATRAQAAALFQRFCENVANK